MKNKRKPVYEWDAENGVATCFIFDQNEIFVGMAVCHEEDTEFMSEKTGMTIAEYRATIKYLQHQKNNRFKPELAGLKQLYYSINHSKHFNPKSYEAKMLFRQIKSKENDIAIVDEMIETARKQLREFIKDKESLYINLRKNRGKKD